MANYLDLAGLTAYDAKLKQWFNAGIVDITSDEINGLFVTPISYQMVDLGLPSGLKWADRNVGAENPWDNGLYFSWGNIDGHAVDESGNVIDGYSFDSDTYRTTLGGQYRASILDAEHDAATKNMGEKWRMPTVDEIVELVENTEYYYIGKDGNIVDRSELNYLKELRSICFVKQGEDFDYDNRSNFIEFPFAGDCFYSRLRQEGLEGNVWSSSIYNVQSKSAYNLHLSCAGTIPSDSHSVSSLGRSVRGVHA